MDVVKKPAKVRIISGTPLEMDALVNELVGDYVIQSINWCQGHDRVIVSLLLVLASEIRMAQLIMSGPQPGRPQ